VHFTGAQVSTAIVIGFGYSDRAAECGQGGGDVGRQRDPNSFSVGVIPLTRDAALKRGISPEEVGRWVEDLQSRTSEGQWFFCLNRFVFTATK
jgi:hypothetical protein